MSLLFDLEQSLNVSFEIKSTPDKNGADTVLVGKNLWTHFQQDGNSRVALSVCSVRPRQSSQSERDSLKALTCWAALDEEVRFFFSVFNDQLTTYRWLN